METIKELNTFSKGETPSVSPGTYSPITVYNQDSLGTLIIGLLALILLFRLVRSEKTLNLHK
jgi:hypothetical protein